MSTLRKVAIAITLMMLVLALFVNTIPQIIALLILEILWIYFAITTEGLIDY